MPFIVDILFCQCFLEIRTMRKKTSYFKHSHCIEWPCKPWRYRLSLKFISNGKVRRDKNLFCQIIIYIAWNLRFFLSPKYFRDRYLAFWIGYISYQCFNIFSVSHQFIFFINKSFDKRDAKFSYDGTITIKRR